MALAANDSTTTRRRFRNLVIDAVAAAPVATVADAPVAMPTMTVANSAGLAQLARLPETAEEITSIARVLQADVANDVFLGRAASEKNVKSGQLNNRRIVMFATHGLVPGDLNGLTQPALALSAPEVTGNAGEDGLLTMEEVLGLKLNADWVVLSACNTASGDGAGSEAVSGLGKAFFFAGARTLLVSNWPVETVSARLLTTKLFEHQAANATATRAEALRVTMLDLMDNGIPTEQLGARGYTYAHPMFWAPFSLVGDGGR
jgi:CHAT domain-containing protein